MQKNVREKEYLFFSKRYRKIGAQMKHYERGTFSVQMVYKRARGWTLGQSLPTKNVLDHPSSSRLYQCICSENALNSMSIVMLLHNTTSHCFINFDTFVFYIYYFFNFCCVPYSCLGKIWVHLGIFKILELLISCKGTILQTDLQYIIQSKPFTTFSIAYVGEGDCDICQTCQYLTEAL